MKKIMLLILVAFIYFGAYAQDPYGNGKMSNDSTPNTGMNVQNGYVKKDGKTMMVNDGKFSTLKKDVTLPNGTEVMTNGSYKTKDGTKIDLKEGDLLDMNGNLTTWDNSKSMDNNNQMNNDRWNNKDQQKNDNNMKMNNRKK